MDLENKKVERWERDRINKEVFENRMLDKKEKIDR